jgi:hypothetical protein
MRKLCIEFRNLPARPRRLTPGEMSAVFGGCSPTKDACNYDSECCSNDCVTGSPIPGAPGSHTWCR